jgi:hypothetical protein
MWYVTIVDSRDITSPSVDNPKSSAMDVDNRDTWNPVVRINKPEPTINRNTSFQGKELWRQQGQTLWKAELYQRG